MKKVIAYLLVLSTFLAPMAWALDTHEQAMDGHTKITLEHAMLDTEHDNHDADQSDHCDHGIAHLVTLVDTFSQDLYPLNVTISPDWDDAFTNHSINPPYRPPIL